MSEKRYWKETHVNCDFCGKWYNPEIANAIYNICNEKPELGLDSTDKRDNCCKKCYEKLKSGGIK